jgi:hypothetical protein
MKSFMIYHHPAKGYIVIKQGFSWPAFFFWWMWAFWKKMWVLGILLLIFSIPVELSFGVHPLMWFLLATPFSILVGVKGNAEYCASVEGRGYEFKGNCRAFSKDAALAQYIGSKDEDLKDDSKQCPYCAETIKKEAVICRFCNQSLN